MSQLVKVVSAPATSSLIAAGFEQNGGRKFEDHRIAMRRARDGLGDWDGDEDGDEDWDVVGGGRCGAPAWIKLEVSAVWASLSLGADPITATPGKAAGG